MKPLSPKKQIELLLKIKGYIQSPETSKYFLCNAYCVVTRDSTPIKKALTPKFIKNIKWESREEDFKQQVPLFNLDNAKQFGADPLVNGWPTEGWWPYYELEKRVQYIDWMVEENQKLLL